MNELAQFPIHDASSEDKEEVSSFVAKLQELTKKYAEALERIQKVLIHEIEVEKKPKKLNDLEHLSFESLLALSKKEWSVEKKAELMGFYSKSVKELGDMSSEINSSNSDLDKLIFKIYELTPEQEREVLAYKVL